LCAEADKGKVLPTSTHVAYIHLSEGSHTLLELNSTCPLTCAKCDLDGGVPTIPVRIIIWHSQGPKVVLPQQDLWQWSMGMEGTQGSVALVLAASRALPARGGALYPRAAQQVRLPAMPAFVT